MKWALKETNTLLDKFIYQGTDRIPREALVREVKRRGLNLPLLSHRNMALRMFWIHRVENRNINLKEFLDELKAPEMLVLISNLCSNREMEEMDILLYNKVILKSVIVIQVKMSIKRTWPTSVKLRGDKYLITVTATKALHLEGSRDTGNG